VASYVVVFAAGAAPVSCSVGTQLYAGSGTSFAHSGLVNGTTYGYRACAVDGAGNVSVGVVRSALLP
jgi:hypothetical protein